MSRNKTYKTLMCTQTLFSNFKQNDCKQISCGLLGYILQGSILALLVVEFCKGIF